METLYDNQWSPKRVEFFYNAKGNENVVDDGSGSTSVNPDLDPAKFDPIPEKNYSMYIGIGIAGALLITAGVVAYKHFKR